MNPCDYYREEGQRAYARFQRSLDDFDRLKNLKQALANFGKATINIPFRDYGRLAENSKDCSATLYQLARFGRAFFFFNPIFSNLIFDDLFRKKKEFTANLRILTRFGNHLWSVFFP
jgi:hypothetical protein